jgi:hypothetical protein
MTRLCANASATGRLSSRVGVPHPARGAQSRRSRRQSQTHRGASIVRKDSPLRRKRRRKLPAVARVPLAVSQGPDERWSMDFIHDQLAIGRRFRCLTLVDDFTRQCLAIHVDTSIGGASVVAVLQRWRSLADFPRPSPWTMVPSSPVKPSTSGRNAPALLSIISNRANRCRTPSSRASMGPSATTVSTNIGLAPWPKPDSSSNTGALTTITTSALTPPSVASLPTSLP